MLKTTNWGLDWFIDNHTPFPVYTMNFHDIHLASNSTLYAPCTMLSTSGYRIFENPSPSAASAIWSDAIVNQPIFNITSYSDSIVWGVGDSGYVVVNVPPATLEMEEPYSKDSFLEVYPNPVNSYLTINSYEKIISSCIYNLKGEKMKSSLVNANQIDVNDLETGIYFIQLNYESGLETIKFIKD